MDISGAIHVFSQQTHPKPVALAHIVLRTTSDHFQAMVDFYMRVLGAEPVHSTPNMIFLRYDEEHHRIAIIHAPENKPKAQDEIHAEVDHIAFTYASLTHLAQTYMSLKSGEDPLYPIWSVNHGPTTSLYYRDPDGNKVELQVDNFDTAEEADAFMKGPLFTMNPIGTDIEPDAWSTKILSCIGPDGQEGLSTQKVRDYKTRCEIGQRNTLPIGFN